MPSTPCSPHSRFLLQLLLVFYHPTEYPGLVLKVPWSRPMEAGSLQGQLIAPGAFWGSRLGLWQLGCFQSQKPCFLLRDIAWSDWVLSDLLSSFES